MHAQLELHAQLEWSGCYDSSWRGIIVPEAYRHPAKFARGLIQRIYRHMLQQGYVRPGMTVVDPFGGVALGAVDAMENGLRWVGVELEPHFHKLGNENLALWAKRWGLTGGTLLQGDSRRVASVLAAAGACVSSPPFSTPGNQPASVLQPGGRQGVRSSYRKAGADAEDNYGTTPGQLGAMPPGEAIVSSPPYVSGGHHPDQTGAWNKNGRGQGQTEDVAGYGKTEGQLGQLPAGDCVVSSPPYESSVNREGEWGHSIDPQKNSYPQNRSAEYVEKHQTLYGSSEGQLGQEQGETFWTAARTILLQCYAVLPAGAYAAWVCKDFVRAKERVPFSDQWRLLCEACGFETVEWIKASLVKERVEATLFEGRQTRTKSKKSFFRRLAERRGSPRIDNEDVLILRRR